MSATPPPRPLSYEEAMANQNYNNLMQEQEARRAALRATFGETAPVNPAIGLPTLMPIGGPQSMPPAFYDVGRGLPSPQIMEEMQRRKDAPTLMPIGQFSPEQMQNLSQERRQALEQRMAIEQFQRNLPNQMPVNGQNATAYQRNAGGSLVPVQAPRPIQGDYNTTGRPVGVQPNLPSNFIGQVPQNAQMQNYNNFLQQGMQNRNAMNQGAMANFANMQPGMQAPQAGIGQTQRGQPAQFRRLPQQRQTRLSGSPIGRSAF